MGTAQGPPLWDDRGRSGAAGGRRHPARSLDRQHRVMAGGSPGVRADYPGSIGMGSTQTPPAQGAPQARQIADLFHLVQDLQAAIERQLNGLQRPVRGYSANPGRVADNDGLGEGRIASPGRERPESGGITPPWPTARVNGRWVRTDGRIRNRTRRCKLRTGPAAAGRRLVATIASVETCSPGNSPGSSPYLQ